MALRFNPPPNWPAPPDGFVPPAGWQPDPAWGPAPEGWQLWVDDSATGDPNASAPQSASGSDPTWAPTQAVSTGSSAPVADPTGAPVSAPSGDYASGPMSSPNPMMSAPSGMSAAPSTSSASSASPYAASMDYAQAPTPYQNQPYQGPGMPADPQASRQPGGVGNPAGGSPDKPVTKQWWFWTIIAVVVVALVAVGVVVALNLNKDDDEKGGGTHTGKGGPTHSQPTGGPTHSQPTNSTDDGLGTTMTNPATMQNTFTFQAESYSDDPEATVDVAFEEIQWDATQAIKEGRSYGFETPSPDQVYIRLKIKITYHGKGKFDPSYLRVAYVKDGNSTDASYVSMNDELSNQSAPRDGGNASGYVTFLVSKSDVKEGVFGVSVLFYQGQEMYVKAE